MLSYISFLENSMLEFRVVREFFQKDNTWFVFTHKETVIVGMIVKQVFRVKKLVGLPPRTRIARVYFIGSKEPSLRLLHLA